MGAMFATESVINAFTPRKKPTVVP